MQTVAASCTWNSCMEIVRGGKYVHFSSKVKFWLSRRVKSTLWCFSFLVTMSDVFYRRDTSLAWCQCEWSRWRSGAFTTTEWASCVPPPGCSALSVCFVCLFPACQRVWSGQFSAMCYMWPDSAQTVWSAGAEHEILCLLYGCYTWGELFGVNQPRGQKIKALGNLGRGPDPPLVSCLLTEQCDANWSAKRRPPLHQQPRQSQCL